MSPGSRSEAGGCRLTPFGESVRLLHIGETFFVVIDNPSTVKKEENMAEYDLIIRNGTIVDGTGGIPPTEAMWRSSTERSR